MRNGIVIVLCLCLLLSMAGCRTASDRPVSCTDVIGAYEAAGYAVYHRDDPEKKDGYLCEVTIEESDGDSIRFYFYETAEEAQASSQERQWNGLLWLFTVINSDPTWLETETYQNIAIEYDDDDLYKPFRNLIQ